MTDLEKLVARTENAMCVEEVTTKQTYFNCFGEKTKEEVKTTTEFYMFDKDKIKWIKGITNEEDK